MPQTRYRFGEFELDPASRDLWRGSARIALPPKSFECLAYLIAHRERAVGRDELISAVWGRVDASDTLVAQTLLRARKALDDTGDRQAMIRTVPRFGYRWVAPVQEVVIAAAVPTIEAPAGATPAPAQTPQTVDIHISTAGAALSPAADGPVTPGVEENASNTLADAPALLPLSPSRPRRTRWQAVAAMLLLLALCACALYVWWARSLTPVTAPAQMEEVALVLPVRVAPADPETSWVRLGAMEYIANRARRGGLRVLPSDQTLHLSAQLERDTAQDAPSWQRLHAASGARWVVSPQATRDGRGWRVRLQWDDRGQERMVEAHGNTALAAAAAATDAWLGREGRRPPQDTPTALTERVQQIDAELTAGQLASVRRLIELAPAEQRRDPRLRVRQAQLSYRSGQIDQAEHEFLSLLEPITAADPADVRARALMGLGAVGIRRRDFVQAQARYSQALDVLQAAPGGMDDSSILGNAYNGRGVALVEQGQIEAAVRDMGLARVAMQRSGDLVEAAMVGSNLGIIESRRGHHPQAVQEFDRAIATYERFGVRDYLAATLASKSEAQLQLAQPAAALATADRAAELVKGLEDPTLAIKVGAAHAYALVQNGALAATQRELTQLHALGLPDDDTTVRDLTLRLLLARDQLKQAGALARRPLHEGAFPSGTFALSAVQAALRSDDLATARQWIARMPAQPDRDARCAWYIARSLVAQRGGQRERALLDLQASSRPDDNADDRIGLSVAQAMMMLDSGQTQAAAAVLGELDAYADSDYRVAWSTLALYRMLGDAGQAERARAQADALRGERDLAVPPVL
ncbi:MAG TPA: winged helix-turn-helix domain-containing protein [Stenotrophomonas sp.]|jgi:DNA-binding winged helix-turn-helix (wHTH) protein/tetratricopeptide (TPR) repeat protein